MSNVVNKTYKPIPGNDELEFVLKPRTIANYENLKRLFIESANVAEDDKNRILNEMGWPESAIKKDFNTPSHYRQCAVLLFEGYDKNAPTDANLDMRIIDSATQDFFFG